ncbi:MAG: ATP-dependent Clp protease adaptor ClpS [Myxococcota bacterium]
MSFENEDETGVATQALPKEKVKRPRLYKVLMHNDDYTTREFVVYVLQSVFRKTEQEAVRIMLHVHQHGTGVAGLYSREIAETKLKKAERLAQSQDYPLRLSMEPEGDED